MTLKMDKYYIFNTILIIINMADINVNLLSGRSLKQGMGKELGKVTDKYRDSVSICELHPKDMEILDLNDGDTIKVTTKYGNVNLTCTASENIPIQGMIFIPYGPYVNMLIGADTDSTGMPSFKGIAATVEPVPREKVLTIRELVSILGR